jgi:Bacterial surface proteins containing Ig-like domains
MKTKLPAFALFFSAALCLGSLLSCTNGQTTVSVTGVALSASSASVAVGGTYQIAATVSPSDATTQTVTWASSDKAIATVDTTGLVAGVAAGSATITVTTDDGGFTATCAVTVSKAVVSVTGVSLNQSSLSIAVSATYQLTATVSPSDATTKTVTWSSSDKAIATVDATGLVTGVAAGSATITVTTTDGVKTATCAVTVTHKGTVPDNVGSLAANDYWRGIYSSSDLSSIQGIFKTAYQKALDGGFNPGTPEDYATLYWCNWSSTAVADVYYQLFSGGDSTASGGSSAECKMSLLLHDKTAYIIKNDFYAFRVENSKLASPKVIGDPITDEYVSGSYRYQDFVYGKMREPSSGGGASAVEWIPYDATASSGRAQPVHFSHFHGTGSWWAASPFTVTLSATDYSGAAISGAAIYYTLDGTTPTSSSTLYSSPISISSASDTTITAVAVVNGNSSYPIAHDFSVIPAVSPNLLSNGDFSSGLHLWSAVSNDNDRVYMSAASGAATLSMGSLPGSLYWSKGMANYSDVKLEKGTTYCVQFDGWADASRSIHVVLHESGIDTNSDGNIWSQHGEYICNLTTNRTNYKWSYTMSDTTDPYSSLVFFCGLDTTPVHIASVSVKKIDTSSGATFNIGACTRVDVGDYGRYYTILLNYATSAWAYFDIATAGSYTIDIINDSGLTLTSYPQKNGDPSQPDTSSSPGSTTSSGVFAGNSLAAQRYFLNVTQGSALWNTVSIKVY